jgi:hypothetical protein
VPDGRRKGRPSREQVRAWLTTVISPLVSALRIERRQVNRKNWSFRCETRDFELLWPIERMVAVPYLPNLQQLLRYCDQLRPLTQDHDRGLEELRTATRTAYYPLLKNEEFRTLALSASITETDQRYFAEAVLNGARDVGAAGPHGDVWAREGGKFLGLRDTPDLAGAFGSLVAAGRAFEGAIASLLAATSALQAELADTYGLPPVEPIDAVPV